MSHICTIATLSTQTLHLSARPDRFAGVGRPLGSLERATALLSAEKETAIREKIESMVRAGCGDKLELLLDELFALSFLSEEALNDWYAEFALLEEDEGMAVSLATLVVSILRPALAISMNDQEQRALVVLEARAVELICILIADLESVEGFIDDCDKGLQDRKLLQDRSKVVRAAGLAKIEAIEAKMRRIDSSTQQAFNDLKGRLQVLQREREDTHREQVEEVEALRAAVEQIERQTRSFCGDNTITLILREMLSQVDQEDSLIELAEKVDDTATAIAVDNSLDSEITACKQLLEKEIVCSALGPAQYLLIRLKGKNPESLIKNDIT